MELEEREEEKEVESFGEQKIDTSMSMMSTKIPVTSVGLDLTACRFG